MPMSQEVHVCTVQLVLPAHVKPEQTADHVSSMLGELQSEDFIIDWRYLKVGGQWLYPTPLVVPSPYREGDAWPAGPVRMLHSGHHHDTP